MDARIPGISLTPEHWNAVTVQPKKDAAFLDRVRRQIRRRTVAFTLMIGGSSVVLLTFWPILGVVFLAVTVPLFVFDAVSIRRQDYTFPGPTVYRTEFIDPRVLALADQLTAAIVVLSASPLAASSNRSEVQRMLTLCLFNVLDALRGFEASGHAGDIPEDLIEASGELENAAARAAELAGIDIPLPVMEEPLSVRDLATLTNRILSSSNA